MEQRSHALPLAAPPVAAPLRLDRLDLPCDPASVPAARRRVRATLHAWGRDDLEEAGSLVVSEMVTNAVLHAGSAVRLELLDGGQDVVLVVGDDSPVVPSRRHHRREASTGRGLWLLDHFTSARGVQVAGRGKRVWAVLCPEVQGPDEGHGALLATLLDDVDGRGGTSAGAV